ncbi:MAG: 16S rRNA (uracil(1498)-N(3))-methyltransferase [Sneathiellales bacterium]|nr:16S rRNA (uracil(1498)-N(3))-methyltransferase [Sneathiellales bacterium]
MSTGKSPIRLYVTSDLKADQGVFLDRSQAHYVGNVMRRQVGDPVILFNGRNGEWSGEFQEIKKNAALVHVMELLREQKAEPDLRLYFSPLKKTQTSLVIQKATELGVSEIYPVLTSRTNAEKIRLDKMELQALEASEQCERLTIPVIHKPMKLDQVLTGLEADRTLVFCNERSDEGNTIKALQPFIGSTKVAILIGPEGGFSKEEADKIASLENCVPVTLGPRVLRAETAAISVITLVQSVLGDWQ